VRCELPALGPGAVAAAVAAASGGVRSLLGASLTVLGEMGTLAGVRPESGPQAGGTAVLVEGSGLAEAG
jgi:hypothetical protein